MPRRASRILRSRAVSRIEPPLPHPSWSGLTHPDARHVTVSDFWRRLGL